MDAARRYREVVGQHKAACLRISPDFRLALKIAVNRLIADHASLEIVTKRVVEFGISRALADLLKSTNPMADLVELMDRMELNERSQSHGPGQGHNQPPGPKPTQDPPSPS